MYGAVGARPFIDPMTDRSEHEKGQPAFGEAALFGLCPRCGARTMFAGPVQFADRCDSCDLDYSSFNVGDGPAAFLTLVIGAIIVVLAIWLELAFEPPWWLHVILWLPMVILGVIGGLRLAKGALLVREFGARAQEHRHKGDKQP